MNPAESTAPMGGLFSKGPLMRSAPEHSAPAIPAVGRARPVAIPAVTERVLRNGLRVIVLRRPTVPRFEVRLRVPAGLIHDRGDGARARLLPETLLGGTAARDSVELARALQRLGASIDAGVDADDLSVRGDGLAGNLGPFLDLLAEVVRTPSFPADEVAIARDRAAQEILIARAQPQTIASEAAARRIFGRHRYGRGLPDPDAVRRVGRGPIATFHGERVLPRGSTLILVGDVRPQKAVEEIERAFAAWKGRTSGKAPPAPPALPRGLPALLVDRPGAVQTNIRLAGSGLPRRHEDFYALALASMVAGGYFSSRLFKNIRELRGYTYGVQSVIEHRRLLSTFTLATSVATEVTAPSLLEIQYELARMAALPVEREELDAARRYLAGATALQIQTQAGLASYLDAITAAGLGVDYIRAFRRRLDAVTVEHVREAAIRFLAPQNLTTVLVGDASKIHSDVEALTPVEPVS